MFTFAKPVNTVNGRDPFKKSEQGLINYDLDSEDELAEFQGEDIDDDEEDYYGSECESMKRKVIGRDDEASELYEENFIVDSDYVSGSSQELDLPAGATEEEIAAEKRRKHEEQEQKR